MPHPGACRTQAPAVTPAAAPVQVPEAVSEGGFPTIAGGKLIGATGDGKLIGATGASGGFASQDAVTSKAGLAALGIN